MDFLDIFANMGWGLAVVIGVIVVSLMIMFLGRLMSAVLMSLGGLFLILIAIVLVCAVIYFIGKFSRQLLSMR